MRKSILTVAATLALGLFATAVQAADTYLFQWVDGEPGLTANTYKNGNPVPIQSVVVGNEVYGGQYTFFSQPGGPFLLADVNVSVNILELSGALSDTWNISGHAGDVRVAFPFNSDVNGASLVPLANATSIFETGQFQTVAVITVSNGDTYTFQFQSDVTEVPEPATWALMLGGFGLVGFAARRRKAATFA